VHLLIKPEEVIVARELWPLAVEVMRALHAQYSQVMELTAAAAGVARPAWFLLLPSLLFEPEPVSAAKLRVRMPYNAPDYYNEGLAALAERGMLVPAAAGEYRLTENGRETVQRIVHAAYARMAELAPMPAPEMDALAHLLQRLVEASLTAPEPPGKWSIRLSRRTDPGEEAPVVVRIDQYLSDLAAYRDDAHLAAWQPYGIGGAAWEAFTLLWRGEAETLDELCQALAWRRYAGSVYAAAVQGLSERGWVAANGEKLRVTACGQAIRQQAEENTDRGFFAPWTCLNEAELAMLEALLRQLCGTLGGK
jgi:hypothetical protein